MSLSQIRYFVAVANEGHVGRAAASLRIAQPAVSRQIHKLEDELGAPLFVRTPRGMTLSGAGHVFLAHARAILEQTDRAAEDVRALASTGRSPPGSQTGGCARTRALRRGPSPS
ncbi:MAG: LysR family transcriptional regulator [Polyangiaceae bacterium]|nr:LysR family transcriptional regulator [Polyangiaceae bacterium]